jgi:hypothetical protein
MLCLNADVHVPVYIIERRLKGRFLKDHGEFRPEVFHVCAEFHNHDSALYLPDQHFLAEFLQHLMISFLKKQVWIFLPKLFPNIPLDMGSNENVSRTPAVRPIRY